MGETQIPQFNLGTPQKRIQGLKVISLPSSKDLKDKLLLV
jgi:hypothetical protein